MIICYSLHHIIVYFIVFTFVLMMGPRDGTLAQAQWTALRSLETGDVLQDAGGHLRLAVFTPFLIRTYPDILPLSHYIYFFCFHCFHPFLPSPPIMPGYTQVLFALKPFSQPKLSESQDLNRCGLFRRFHFQHFSQGGRCSHCHRAEFHPTSPWGHLVDFLKELLELILSEMMLWNALRLSWLLKIDFWRKVVQGQLHAGTAVSHLEGEEEEEASL